MHFPTTGKSRTRGAGFCPLPKWSRLWFCVGQMLVSAFCARSNGCWVSKWQDYLVPQITVVPHSKISHTMALMHQMPLGKDDPKESMSLLKLKKFLTSLPRKFASAQYQATFDEYFASASIHFERKLWTLLRSRFGGSVFTSSMRYCNNKLPNSLLPQWFADFQQWVCLRNVLSNR